eukprot:NODE_8897_length_635_cov_42.970703_g8272_i0.p1 GENE.NODE_8897_length_635_cov_42.970703_g8272_i0~~NODE_8897_length_635_cov_42.970703_g8272_i0.p1  ORF type:complete len:169 (-),score=37.58 NODE_8897_length_635_cov_42.970703_g8272_i0:62-568(-)
MMKIRSISKLASFVRFSSTTAKGFRVLGVQQVAVGGLDKPALRNFWGEILGGKFIKSFVSEKENVDEDVLEFGRGLGKVELDVMAPLNPEKSPKVHIPALNHIGLWVDDLPTCVKYLESKGLKTVGGIRKGASGFDITFVHPKSTGGILLELVQAPSDVIDEYNRTKE